MKRDDILGMLKAIARDVDCDEEDIYPELRPAIDWLERLPKGCELVGCNPMNELDGTERAVYDVSAARGNGTRIRAWFVNPDDLTKAGKR